MLWRKILLLILLVSFVGQIPYLTSADDNLNLPPRVIDVYPFPGMEMIGQHPLTISFDQPMDVAQVNHAITLEPNIDFIPQWLDARTLNLIPQADWGVDTRYVLTVGPDAQAQNGLHMEFPYSATLHGATAFRMAEVSPSTGTIDLALDTRITITFNRPVVALESNESDIIQIDPITIEPSVSGQGEWVNTSMYVFTPANDLAGGTTYQITLRPDLETFDDIPIQNPETWSFTTLTPRINYMPYSSSINLDSPIIVRFNQSMDQQSTEAAFNFYYQPLFLSGWMRVSVRGMFTWNDSSTELTFQPDKLLNRQYSKRPNYHLVMKRSALNYNRSSTLDKDYTSNMSSNLPFAVSGVSASWNRFTQGYSILENGDWLPGAYPIISFTTPLNPDSVEERILIDPMPENLDIQADKGLALLYASLPETDYTITLLAGIEDIYGDELIHDFVFHYHTGIVPPDATLLMDQNRYYDPIQILNGYRDTIALPFLISGDPTLTFSLRKIMPQQVSFPNFADVKVKLKTWLLDLDYKAIERWSERVGYHNAFQETIGVPLHGKNDERLQPGLYYLGIQYRTILNKSPNKLLFAVTTANLTVKRSTDEVLVWVTDLKDGQPLPHTRVTLYNGGTIVATEYTDDLGVVRLPVNFRDDSGDTYYYDDNSLVITAEDDATFGIWYSRYEPSIERGTAFIYTDRAIYRPGDTVYFKGFVRNRRDMDFSIPDPETIAVRMTIGQNSDYIDYPQQVFEISDFGTISGSFSIPLDAQLGYGAINMGYDYTTHLYYNGFMHASASFRVADYRAAGYEVTITSPVSEIYEGDWIDLEVQARYFSGEPVQNANSYINIRGCPLIFTYLNYRFYDEDWDYQENQRPYYYEPSFPGADGRCTMFTETIEHLDGMELIYNGVLDIYSATTDGNGQISVRTNMTTFHNRRPVVMAIEGRINVDGVASVVDQTTIIAHPASVYVGLKAKTGYINADQSLDVGIVTLTPQKDILPRQVVDVVVEELDWVQVPKPTNSLFAEYVWEMRANPIATTTLITGADATSSYRFIPPASGLYRIHVYSTDPSGNINSSTYRVYVRGDDFKIKRGNTDHHLEITMDKTAYQIGDTAHFFIPLPGPGTWWVLVTTERSEIGDYQVYEAHNGVLEFDLPITENFAPNMWVSVNVMRGPLPADPYPDYASGLVNLPVEITAPLLNIELIPEKSDVLPRQTVSVAVHVTDATGKPVQAEVSLQMVDAAVLALLPERTPSLENVFYRAVPNHVWTDFALRGFKDRFLAGTPNYTPVPMMGGGGSGAITENPRTEFVTTPLWAAQVVTDENGDAHVQVTMPDNLTRWKITAKAITRDTQLKVGDASTTITTSLPFNIRPQTPRFMIVGDRIQLGVIVVNNTDSNQQVDVELESDGVTLDDPAIQSITIQAKGQQEINWWVRVEDVPYVKLVFGAKAESGYQDAVVPDIAEGPDHTIPVYRYQATDTVATGGIVTTSGSQMEGISLPYRLLDARDSELLINIDPSLAASVIETLDYLKDSPDTSIEQTISRFLPNIMVYTALKQLGVKDADLEFNLIVNLNAAQEKLRNEELPDGGWAWVYSKSAYPNDLVTAYATLGLIEAQKAGFPVDETMLERAVNFVRSRLVAPDALGRNIDLNRQAFYLYILARYGDNHLIQMSQVAEFRRNMTYQGQAYLLMAYTNTSPNARRVADLVSDLVGGAVLTANGAHWEEHSTDWYNWSSDVQSTALALSALIQADPNNHLLPSVIRWLLVARRDSHWQTTQETVWVIGGFTNWMVTTQELTASYHYQVSMNEKLVAEGVVNPNTSQTANTFEISMGSLDLQDLNRLAVAKDQDAGALYYTAYLNLKFNAADVPASSQGISVQREYFLATDPEAPVTSAKAGDVLNVRVAFTLTQDVPYFVLEVPIASGMEMADASLNTTTMLANGQHIVRTSEKRYWSWGYWWFDRTELRDDKAVIYAHNLPVGTYIYTYQVEAIHPGQFQIIPAHGSSLYFPELYGRSNGTLFTIEGN